MIEDLLPPDVMAAEMWEDDPSATLFPQEAAQIHAAVETRKREFATARSCARRALAKLGVQAGAILQGTHREPIWPSGIAGSITHCQGYRAAAVVMQSDLSSVGIDAEIHDALPFDVLGGILVEPETAWLVDAPEGVHWDRVIFSAKESIYKAWFPLTGRWLGFEDVAVALSPETGRFRAQLLIDPPRIGNKALNQFEGSFVIRKGLVLTATTVPISVP